MLLILLWLFQVVFLDAFYKKIKIKEIQNSGNTIEWMLGSKELGPYINNLASNYDTCIQLISSDGSIQHNAAVTNDCIIHKMGLIEKMSLYIQTKEKGGEQLLYFEKAAVNPENGKFADRAYLQNINKTDSILYSKVVTDKEGREAILFMNAMIAPVSATVSTLRIQLYWITIAMILLSIVLAFFIAKKVSRPIVEINSSAKDLAKGNYEVHFHGEGYKEIAELSKTLNYTAQELSKVDSLQRELIANISHDLRTPLTLIAGYSEIMRDLPGENTPENVQIIIDETQRLTSLVNDVLDLSKLQSGTQELKKKEYNLTQSIEAVIKRFEKLCQHYGYEILFEYEEEISIHADELKISQVIYNFINNAINYTGAEKKIKVRQTIKEGKVKVEVIDTGEGIAKEALPYIWDRYYRVDKTHRRAVTGTGLGLSIVKNILELHEATYGAESKIGQGSTFWFRIKK